MTTSNASGIEPLVALARDGMAALSQIALKSITLESEPGVVGALRGIAANVVEQLLKPSAFGG